MSNHFPLVLQLPDSRALSRFMAGLLRSYVHYCHRQYGFWWHLWQGRFKSPAIAIDEYLLSVGRYVPWPAAAASATRRPFAPHGTMNPRANRFMNPARFSK
jgi:hypothetical protein